MALPRVALGTIVKLHCKVLSKNIGVIASMKVKSPIVVLKQEKPLNSRPPQPQQACDREDFSEYVAHLQLHMALQTRNLVPRLTNTPDSREQLLHQTQANFEKIVSRQSF
jgi:hypothetical protein